jgi:hypothetical protein
VLTQIEPFANDALGKPVGNALRFVVDAPVAARFLVLQN